MPICSYLVYPVAGKAGELRQTLESLPGCEVKVADQGHMLILVTETSDEHREEELQEQLTSIPSIQCLAMTFAHLEPAISHGGVS
mgnify:CR=1 FL=1